MNMHVYSQLFKLQVKKYIIKGSNYRLTVLIWLDHPNPLDFTNNNDNNKLIAEMILDKI